jgi:hypothetical protein
LLWLGLAVLPLFLPHPAAATPVGYSTAGGMLFRAVLPADGETVSWVVVGELPETRVASLVESPDGIVYGAADEWPGPDHLVTLDLETLEVEVIGELEVSWFGTDLAFDDDGRLFAEILGELFEVDPATGAATAVPLPVELEGLAFLDGTAYTLIRTGAVPQIATVDLPSGEVVPVLDVPEMVGEGAFYRQVSELAFDDDGRLWINVLESFGGIDPPAFFPGLVRVDLATGAADDLSLVYDLPGSPAPLPVDLLVRDEPRGVVAIPALGPAGLGLLGLALGAAAGGVFRRARHRG